MLFRIERWQGTPVLLLCLCPTIPPKAFGKLLSLSLKLSVSTSLNKSLLFCSGNLVSISVLMSYQGKYTGIQFTSFIHSRNCAIKRTESMHIQMYKNAALPMCFSGKLLFASSWTCAQNFAHIHVNIWKQPVCPEKIGCILFKWKGDCHPFVSSKFPVSFHSGTTTFPFHFQQVCRT